MKLDVWLQKRMFLFMVLFIVLAISTGPYYLLGFYRTVNWGFDISDWFLYVKEISWPFFCIGYGLLALFKYQTQKAFSAIHLIVISTVFLIVYAPYFEGKLRAIDLFQALSIFVFALNIIWAISNGRKSR